MPEYTQVQLPRDSNSSPVQVLAPGVSVNSNPGVASARVALPTGSEVVLVSVSVDAWVRFGDNTVDASSAGGSIFMAPGAQAFSVPDGATDLAFIANGTTGVGSVTRLL